MAGGPGWRPASHGGEGKGESNQRPVGLGKRWRRLASRASQLTLKSGTRSFKLNIGASVTFLTAGAGGGEADKAAQRARGLALPAESAELMLVPEQGGSEVARAWRDDESEP